jgi:hypothetical protein
MAILPRNKDKLARLFGVATPDDRQNHSKVYDKKTVKELADAIYDEWMKRREREALGTDRENRIAMRELRNVVADSANTVRNRNKRNAIKTTNNFFRRKVSENAVQALRLRARGDLWYEVEAPETLLGYVTYEQRLREPTRHFLSKRGEESAYKEWQSLGCPGGDFYSSLRLCGFTKNTYTHLDQSVLQLQ